jgi:hypothetical protein
VLWICLRGTLGTLPHECLVHRAAIPSSLDVQSQPVVVPRLRSPRRCVVKSLFMVRVLRATRGEEVAVSGTGLSYFDSRITAAWAAGARWVLERIQADRAEPSIVAGEVEAIAEQASKRQSERPKRFAAKRR